MSITDELRESVKQTNWAMTSKAKWFAIADRIDIEHEKLLQEQPFTIDMVPMTDENMAEHGWIRLPKVANNEIVNVGDKLDGYNKTIEVMWLKLGRTGWWIIDKYGESYACCDEFSHHHEPTVEDVLDEFASAYDRIGGEDEEHQKYLDLIAEYAAKLQLRGDGE